MNKKGISLLVLLITVVAVLILVSVITINYTNSKDKAALTTFASDLQKIQDQVKLYYLTNGTFPTFDDQNQSLNESEVMDIIGQEKKEDFKAELSLNNDYVEDTTKGSFYKIDLSKINIKESKTGLSKTTSDVYIVAFPSMNVYYLNGVKAKGDVYFSLSSKIVSYTKVEATQNQSTEQVTNITVSKKINDWTNIEPINIKVNISGSQVVNVKFAGVDNIKRLKNIYLGMNDRTFNLNQLFLNNKDIKGNDVFETALTESEITAFKNVSADQKNISISINDGSSDIETKTLSLSNFDDVNPNMDSSSISQSDDKNILNVVASDSISGVKQVRFDYINKKTATGTVPYYSQSVDGNYVRQNGKVATLQPNGSYNIELPKEITLVFICIEDKAGNWSEYNNVAINT